jgi:serine/threonine protein phosphatase PrpC
MENPRRALEAAFRGVDVELNSMDGLDVEYSGTTAVALHIYGRLITCAWVGDSRAVLGREVQKGRIEALALTCDHKPELPAERRRIEAMDGRVARLMATPNAEGSFRGGVNSAGVGEFGEGPFRVWMKNLWVPGLSMSRSLGDSIAHRVGVTPEPEIRTHEIVEHDRFVIVATDGIWEFVSNEEAVAVVAACDSPEEAATALAKEAFERWKAMGSDEVIDDITVLVAALTNIESRSATSGSQRSSFERLSQGSNGSLESVDENREIP